MTMTTNGHARKASRPTFDEPTLRAFLGCMLDPAIGCAELCAYDDAQFRGGFVEPSDYGGKKIAGWFDDPDALVVSAQRFRNISAYITVNPATRDYLAKAGNRLRRVSSRTADKNIICRRWFYIDIDPDRLDGIGSTNDELAAAVDRRDTILADHPDLAAASLWGKSGNGAWILARLPDYPTDNEHYNLVDRALKILHARYGDDNIKIDVTTKNLARIMPVPGTLKCKGEDHPERPWRLVTLDGMWGAPR